MKSTLTLLFFCFFLFSFSQGELQIEMQNGHTLPISSISIHPEDPIIATGSQDHSVILWNTKTEKQLKSITIAQSAIVSVEYDHTGDYLLILTKSNEVYVYHTPTETVVSKQHFDFNLGYAMSVAFSSNSDLIVIGSNRDDLILWNYKTDEEIISTKGFSTSTNGFEVSPKLDQYVSLHNAKNLHLINMETSDTISLEFDKANEFQFNPTQDYLAVGSNKLFAKVFDHSTGELVSHIEPNPSEQCDGCKLRVKWSPNGKQLATYDHKNGLFVWDKHFDQPIFSIPMTARIEEFNYSASGRYILLSDDKTLWIVDVLTKKVLLKYESKYLNGFSPIMDKDELHFFVPGDLFSLQKIKVSSGKTTAIYKGINNQSANQLPFDYLDWYQSGSLKYFKLKMPMEVSSNSSFAILGKIGLDVQILNLLNGSISTLFKTEKSVTALAISANDSLIAAGDADGNIIIYNKTTNELKSYPNTHSNMIFDLAFSENNESLLSCGWDGRTYALNLIEGNKTFISESESSFFNVVTDNKNLYYFKTNLDNSITMYESDSHQEVRRFIGHTNLVTDVVFDSETQSLYSTSLDGSVRIWDISSGLLRSKFYLSERSAALSIVKHPTKSKLFIGGIDKEIYIFDLNKNKLTDHKKVHNSGIANVKFTNDSTLILRGLDGSIEFVSSSSLSSLFSLFLYPENEWLVIEATGVNFEGTKSAMGQVHLVNGTQSRDIGGLFNHYFRPGLLKSLLKGSDVYESDQGRNIDELMNNSIIFDLAIQDGSSKTVKPLKDSVYDIRTSNVFISIEFQGNSKYDDIYVYNNGKLILTESSDEEVAFRSTKNDVILSIPLAPQKNHISVKIIDKEQVEHSHFPIWLNYDTLAAKTDLFILSLGINEYQNKSYNLKYAKKDALDFSSSLENAASSIYENVYTFSLHDKKVTKDNLLSLVDEIASKIGPEDVFVFYYAGHGVMYENPTESNDFFLIMSDITNLYGGKDLLLEKGISSEELLSISKNIVAQKQVFFLDACQSGAALDVLATRGVSREKTLATLARSSGTFFITASQDIEYANEASSLEHGLFTFAILEMLTGKAPSYADEILSMGELKNYVEQRVPELSETYKTSPQYPTGYSFGNDFPIGALDSK